MDVHMDMRVRTHTHTHTCTRTHPHPHSHTLTLTHTHTHTHGRAHAHAHRHTNTHTYRCGAKTVRLTDRDAKSVWQMGRHAQENCAGRPGACVPEAAVLDWLDLPVLVCMSEWAGGCMC